jgi:hypothetical protein
MCRDKSRITCVCKGVNPALYAKVCKLSSFELTLFGKSLYFKRAIKPESV